MRSHLEKHGGEALEPAAILHPFLVVVRSETTDGIVTGKALNSLDGILAHQFVHLAASPTLAAAVNQVATSIAACKFEHTDATTDELVLMRLLRVMETLMNTENLCAVLTDVSVCSLVETAFQICFVAKYSDTLRDSAERTLSCICRRVFAKVKQMSVSGDSSASSASSAGEVSSVRPAEPTQIVLAANSASAGMDTEGEAAENFAATDAPSSLDVICGRPSSDSGAPDDFILVGQESTTAPASDTISPAVARISAEPYGLICMAEILRVLVSLLEPGDDKHTDAMRRVGLYVLESIILETIRPNGHATIADHPSLRHIVQNDLCRSLFKLSKADSGQVAQLSLRVVALLFQSMVECLRLQQEFFFRQVLLKYMSRPSTSQKSGMLSYILDVVRAVCVLGDM